jgi:hypothetical protein
MADGNAAFQKLGLKGANGQIGLLRNPGQNESLGLLSKDGTAMAADLPRCHATRGSKPLAPLYRR